MRDLQWIRAVDEFLVGTKYVLDALVEGGALDGPLRLKHILPKIFECETCGLEDVADPAVLEIRILADYGC